MKTQQEYIDQGEQYILKTYNRFPVVLEKGDGRSFWQVITEKIFKSCVIKCTKWIMGRLLDTDGEFVKIISEMERREQCKA